MRQCRRHSSLKIIPSLALGTSLLECNEGFLIWICSSYHERNILHQLHFMKNFASHCRTW